MSQETETQQANAAPVALKKPSRVPNGKNLPPSKVAAVLALAEMGVPKLEIARREELSPTTVKALVKQGDQYNPALVDRVKKHLAAHWYVTTERSLNHITDEKLEKSSAAALGVLASIGTEKALLAEGKATSRVEFTTAGDQELEGEIQRLQSELEGWKDGRTVNVHPELDTTFDDARRNSAVQPDYAEGNVDGGEGK